MKGVVYTHCHVDQPEHAEARALQAAAFERLGHGAECGPWRDFYLMGAAELRDGVLGTPARGAPDIIAALTVEQIFRSMAVRITGPRAAAPRGEDPDVTLRLPRTVLDAVMSGATTFADAIARGDAAVEGDTRALLTFGTLTDRPDPRFPIVTG